jgi:hypothetical protein
MALRIDQEIVRGEMDNTVPGRVLGRIWLEGRSDPLQLELAGDCWRDLAGRRWIFTNPQPEASSLPQLASRQNGVVGDMTASRKVRIPDGPIDEWWRQTQMGMHPPERTGNVLYLEWYSDQNGRVVIESADFRVQVSLPEWTMSEAEETAQRKRNDRALYGFLERLSRAIRPRDPVQIPEDRDMDEFEWERFMKEADARSARYGELLDKYGDHPNGDRIIEAAMGWDITASPAAGGSASPDLEGDWLDDSEDDEEDPDPSREGIDWVRTEDGRVAHPVQLRCSNLALRMHRDAEAVWGDAFHDDDVREMVDQVQYASAKLAGALSGFSRAAPFEAGFIVATLKRSLALLNDGIAAFQRIHQRQVLPEQAPWYRDELFAVRDDILRLMNEFRRRET